ncbi:Malonyl-CoA-acyl carrier protein transacylase, mitochondrial [Coccomyxa sp. Obi]|nr:Malonyl-CoA-acyl carrier protein transacylase, mitochondrial [Coccomyxa sp. Obi]
MRNVLGNNRIFSRTPGLQQARLQPVRTTATASVVEKASDTKFAQYTPGTAFLFPGQGAQTVGMAKDVVEEVPAAKDLFDQASEILGYDLLKLCVEGPKDKLDSTVISQPAIYVASLAAVEKLRQTEGEEAVQAADVTAGLSLGEYTALTFAGALKFEDGVRLVKIRGESMQAAADARPSAMVSVIGLAADKVEELCEAANKEVAAEDGVRIANFLCNGNYAVSGGLPGCEAVEKLAKSFKARMTVRLAVAGAFHTSYMKPAEETLREALASTEILVPRIPVVSNVDAQPHSDPDMIKDILARQLTSPVQWETTMKTLLEKGLQKSYEIGPNKVIAGIVKRIDKAHSVTNIQV